MSTETPTERQEAAATRRRWVTLAEVVAVAGVLIAALTLWTNWSDHRADEADKIAAQSSAAHERSKIDLSAIVQDGGDTLLLKDARHDLQDVTITFPRALGVAAQRPPAEPVIDGSWFSAPLLKLTDGGADDRAGRLPVLVSVQYFDGDATRSASGIYDVIWKTEGRVLRGRALKLEGLRVRQRGGDQAKLDAIWAKEKPAA
ncbi:hypothetical protein [Sphingomonas sp. R86520]|uniref:hypothetical protein n=1 Tax=Sphingomonas sp. R86520 TaxID=3093859 RepID=UPI0036D43A27